MFPVGRGHLETMPLSKHTYLFSGEEVQQRKYGVANGHTRLHVVQPKNGTSKVISIERNIPLPQVKELPQQGSARRIPVTAGGLRGLKTPRPWKGSLRPFARGNITVKDNVYRPTSELVSM